MKECIKESVVERLQYIKGALRKGTREEVNDLIDETIYFIGLEKPSEYKIIYLNAGLSLTHTYKIGDLDKALNMYNMYRDAMRKGYEEAIVYNKHFSSEVTLLYDNKNVRQERLSNYVK